MKGNVLIRSKVTPYNEEIRGGAGKLMMNLAEALAETDWHVTIISPQPNAIRSVTKAKNKRLDYAEFNYDNPTTPIGRLIGSVRGRQTFISVVEEKNIDVVIDDVSHLPFYPAHFACPDNVQNVVFLHTALFDAARETSPIYKAPIIELIDRTLPYLRDPEIICAGPSTERRVQTYLDYHQTHILRPYADVEDFEYTFNRESTRLLYLGRLSKRKNIGCLLNTWERIESEYPNYTLTIAGDGEIREDLIKYAESLNLKNVDFPGFVSPERKKKLFEESLLYVTPSLEEGYLTAGLEALAAGTPVVGSDTRGINDYIEQEINGVLFERNNSQALYHALVDLLEEPKQIESLAQAGKETANVHNYDAFREKANEVLQRINDTDG